MSLNRENENTMSRKVEVDAAVADLDFENKNYQLQLETSAGDIQLDLLTKVAPEHCKNLIGLAKIGFYDGLIFHRIIPGFMIQGGCPQGSGTGGPGYNVDAEFNETPHVAGVLSMARSADPNSAGSQFFICLGDHTHLDGQYTAFGQATDASMAIVNSIGNVATNSGDRPNEEVTINKATVVEI
jgi:peptidyl-prolyl cis-trans isomerase B (cyclophilin B)